MATVKGKTPAAAPARPAKSVKKKVPSSVGARRAERERGGKPAKALPVDGPIKVRATQPGFYGLKRRRIGDVFVIRKAQDFSERWMIAVDGKTPTKATGAQKALDRRHDEILGGVAPRQGDPAANSDDDVDDADNDDDPDDEDDSDEVEE